MFDRLASKNLDRWLGGYGRYLVRRAGTRRPKGPRHLLFAMCDHYEPLWGKPNEATGEARVREWTTRYMEMTEPFRDADGRRPQHTFFFPGEEYRPRFFDLLDKLVAEGGGEVELHLHHDNATESTLREEIETYLGLYADRGHLSRSPQGKLRYAFIHGNWALANGRPDGRLCGVDAELPLLFKTGCYADFTFPSAPDVSQPNIVNQIYWPMGELGRRRAYESGLRAKVGERYGDRILMIQGPLALAKRPGLFRIRIDNAAVTSKDPGTPSRIQTWVSSNVHIAGRPEWVFVKVHTHGAPEAQAASLLGDGGRMMHAELCSRYNDKSKWLLHYVTAREMFNIAAAAMGGMTGNPIDYRDFELSPPPIRNGR